MEYTQSVWSPWRKEDLRAIENVQWGVTKRLSGLKNLTNEERLEKTTNFSIQEGKRWQYGGV